MTSGSAWSEQFVRQLADKDVRREFVADQVRARIAMLIRALREQPHRNWTQRELAERAGKQQNVISRLEDPDYGKMSLQSLLEIADAFDLPVWFDMPEWKDWLTLISEVPNKETRRSSFDLDALVEEAQRGSSKVDSLSPPNGSGAFAAAEAIKSMLLSQPSADQLRSAASNVNAPQTDSQTSSSEGLLARMSFGGLNVDAAGSSKLERRAVA